MAELEYELVLAEAERRFAERFLRSCAAPTISRLSWRSRGGVRSPASDCAGTEAIRRRIAASEAEINRSEFVEYDGDNIQELAKDVHDCG